MFWAFIYTEGYERMLKKFMVSSKGHRDTHKTWNNENRKIYVEKSMVSLYGHRDIHKQLETMKTKNSFMYVKKGMVSL